MLDRPSRLNVAADFSWADNVAEHGEIRSVLLRDGYCLLRKVVPELALKVIESTGELLLQYDGCRAFLVTPKASAQSEWRNRLTQNSQTDLPLHSDGAEMSTPPHSVALYCLKQSRAWGPATYLVDMHSLFTDADSELQRELKSSIITFGSLSGEPFGDYAHTGAQTTKSSIFVVDEAGRPVLSRFSANRLIHGTFTPHVTRHERNAESQAVRMAERILEIEKHYRRETYLEPGDLLMWDNWRFAHGRIDSTYATSIAMPPDLMRRAVALIEPMICARDVQFFEQAERTLVRFWTDSLGDSSRALESIERAV